MPFRDVIGHDGPKRLLRSALRHDRLAHAFLFHGEDGIGKRLTAIRLAQAVNCETPERSDSPGDPDACGTCRSCLQIEALTHPDFMLIEPDPEQANPQIKIERIRELESQIIYRPLAGRLKICLFDDADRLTLGAANALLKTLEEPPAHSLFLLVSSRPFALPGTIRSRCQTIRFVPPARTQVEAALVTQRDMPPADARFVAVMTDSRLGAALKADVRALRSAQDDYRALTSRSVLTSPSAILAAAEQLHKSDRSAETLAWLRRWLRDLLLVKIGAEHDLLVDLERLSDLQAVAARLEPPVLLDLLGELDGIERAASRNVNLQMALESVLLKLRDGLEARGTGH